MKFIIKYEDGPCACDCKEITVKATSEDKAIAKVMKISPRAMITSVKEVK